MFKKSILAVLCFSAGILGCSNVPDASDLKSSIEEAWAECSGLKMTDLKKTNGIDHGDTYEMAISYKLVITKNASAMDAWFADAICPMSSVEILRGLAAMDKKAGLPVKVGDSINVNGVFRMIKSENGWIQQ